MTALQLDFDDVLFMSENEKIVWKKTNIPHRNKQLMSQVFNINGFKFAYLMSRYADEDSYFIEIQDVDQSTLKPLPSWSSYALLALRWDEREHLIEPKTIEEVEIIVHRDLLNRKRGINKHTFDNQKTISFEELF